MTKKLTKKESANLTSTLQKIGKSGGQATLKKYGKKHFQKIAQIAWKRRKANAKVPVK